MKYNWIISIDRYLVRNVRTETAEDNLVGDKY